jgi:hypothetical protein
MRSLNRIPFVRIGDGLDSVCEYSLRTFSKKKNQLAIVKYLINEVLFSTSVVLSRYIDDAMRDRQSQFNITIDIRKEVGLMAPQKQVTDCVRYSCFCGLIH